MDGISEKMCGLLGAALSEALGAVLAERCVPAWAVSTEQQSLTPPFAADPEDHYEFAFGERLAGRCFVVVRRADMALLGLKSGPADATKGDAAVETNSAAMLTVFQSAASKMADALQPEFGTISLLVERLAAPDISRDHGLVLQLRADEKSIAMSLFFDADLLAALEAAHARSLVDAAIAGVAPSQRNLELVMDVELSVTIRFGQRQLALREVLELTSGAVVELDRQVDEPVELVLDGRVVARGEAVIIDGNYGMRVLQVMQPVIPTWVHEEA